ncbi:MAG TPA: DUF4388 domain-containing protein [Thermoanaerobaculia bacterium]|nr:DUF4388 domain-containing protein [Thermoanaerobaculia bacterium]
MSEELTIQGTLAETTVPDLCRSLIRSAETAVVTLEAIGRHDSIYLRRGKIVYAATSDPDLGLAEVLLRNGEIGIHDYIRATESATSHQRIGSVLCELGYLKPEELVRALERQVSDVVIHALAYRSGSYTIEFTADFDREIPRLPIQTERLLLDGVGRITEWSLVSRGVGKMERTLRQAADGDSRIYHLDLREDETIIFELLSEPQSVGSICARSYLSNFQTCRTLWALLAVNLVEDEEGIRRDARRSELEREMELESRVESYNSAFQLIFGIVYQEIGDHIYDFLDRVVLHLSPEVLPYLSGINLMNEGRVDFDQLLNNLISSGSTDRNDIVNSVVNELLYGWIFEIRAEFGARLEDRIAPVVDGLKRH